MALLRVLLSEASSLTAREFITVLGHHHVNVEAVSWVNLPIGRFSKWCSAIHRVPAPNEDPRNYLTAIDRLCETGRFDAVLATHEQAWLFAAGRRFLPHARLAVAEPAAFDTVMSKLAFANTMDNLGLPQPAWRPVYAESDVDALGYPVWVKAAFSTAGRGVRKANNHAEAASIWHNFVVAAGGNAGGGVMIQAPAAGAYAQIQAVFDHGQMLAAATSKLVATGVGGSAAARCSINHPQAVDALNMLGRHLTWHGGITLDYFHVDGSPQFVECNPRTVEPGNADAAGVDLPGLTIALATGRGSGLRLSGHPQLTMPGIVTRSTMAMALGAAEQRRTRRAVLSTLTGALAHRPPLHDSTEVLTPIVSDPPSAIPAAIAVGRVLTNPASVTKLAGHTVNDYAIVPRTIERIRSSK